MTESVLRACEAKTNDNETNSPYGVWARLYNGEFNSGGISTCRTFNEDMQTKNSIDIAYIRVSTKQQDEAMQRAFIETQLKLAKIPLADVQFFEEKVSASKKERLQSREEGKKLMALLESGVVKRIFVYKLDRLLRSQRAAHAFVATCQEFGTDVISMDTPSGLLTDEGFLLYSINFMMAEMEVRRLAKRTSDGMAQTRKSGGVTTHAVFGWDVMEVIDADGKPLIGANDKVVKKLVPNWQEYAVLMWIDEQLQKGVSFNKIAKMLNDIGLKGKKGGKWQAQSVKRAVNAKQHQEIVNFTPPKRMAKWPFADLRKKQQMS